MSGVWQTPLSGANNAPNSETLNIRVSAEDKEMTLKQNSEMTKVESKTRKKTLELSIAGLLALIPKAYLCKQCKSLISY